MTASAVALGACSGVSGPGASTGSDASQPPRSTSAPVGSSIGQVSGTQPPDVDVCALVSLADVQGVSPFTTPLVDASAPGAKEACYYTAAVNADATATVTLVISAFESPELALANFHADEQFMTDHDYAAEPVAGVGDIAAGWPGTEDEVKTEAASGAYVLATRFKGEWKEGAVPDVDPEAKVQAGAELLKLAISRLP